MDSMIIEKQLLYQHWTTKSVNRLFVALSELLGDAVDTGANIQRVILRGCVYYVFSNALSQPLDSLTEHV